MVGGGIEAWGFGLVWGKVVEALGLMRWAVVFCMVYGFVPCHRVVHSASI